MQPNYFATKFRFTKNIINGRVNFPPLQQRQAAVHDNSEEEEWCGFAVHYVFPYIFLGGRENNQPLEVCVVLKRTFWCSDYD